MTLRFNIAGGLRAGLLAVLAGAAPLLAGDAFVSLGFLEIPPQIKLRSVSAVDVDAQGRVYVLHRGEPPILAFDREGRFTHGWADGMFELAHGLRVDRQGDIWTTDNQQHVIRKFDRHGRLLLTLGRQGVGGADERLFRTPDDIAFNSHGEIYIADAGNGRIVRLTADGGYIGAWGARGKRGEQHKPGEFAAAHGIAVDSADRVFVADRGNGRVQVFDREGRFLAEWKGFGNPFGVLAVGGELIVTDGDAHKLIVLALEDGGVLETWGPSGALLLPHLLAEAPDGTLYLAEVSGERIQKLRRVRN